VAKWQGHQGHPATAASAYQHAAELAGKLLAMVLEDFGPMSTANKQLLLLKRPRYSEITGC
jgi:hypothetical protein